MVTPLLVAAAVVTRVARVARVARDGGEARAVRDAPPLELASVSTDVAAHYEYAAAHEAAYRQIPCYRGCEEFLAHRDLYECFVRPDGRGWEAHASGCGVCLGESALARRLLERGDPAGAVRDTVIEEFGSTPAAAPPES